MARGGSHMANNIKYTNSENYNKHLDFNTRIKIQKVITDNRDQTGSVKLTLKSVGEISKGSNYYF